MEATYAIWIHFALLVAIVVLYFYLDYKRHPEFESLVNTFENDGLGPVSMWIEKGKVLWPWWNDSLPRILAMHCFVSL